MPLQRRPLRRIQALLGGRSGARERRRRRAARIPPQSFPLGRRVTPSRRISLLHWGPSIVLLARGTLLALLALLQAVWSAISLRSDIQSDDSPLHLPLDLLVTLLRRLLPLRRLARLLLALLDLLLALLTVRALLALLAPLLLLLLLHLLLLLLLMLLLLLVRLILLLHFRRVRRLLRLDLRVHHLRLLLLLLHDHLLLLRRRRAAVSVTVCSHHRTPLAFVQTHPIPLNQSLLNVSTIQVRDE